MKDADDLVEEYGALLLKDLCYLNEVFELNYHKNHVEAMSRYHDFKGTISRGYIVTDD